MFEEVQSTAYSRNLLLIKINSYYRNLKLKLTKEMESLDELCNNPDLQQEKGFVKLLGDSELTCLFYCYRNSVSFLALKVNGEYRVISETYSKTTDFFRLLSYDIGLCYEIFLKEMELISDSKLSEELYNEAQLLKQYLDRKEKSLSF